MINSAIVLLLFFFLSACQSTQQIAYNSAVQDCQTQPKNIQAKCLINHPNYNRFSAEQREVTTYTSMISEKVANKQISETEAAYLIQAYANKVDANKRIVNAQEDAALAQRQRSADEGVATGMALMCSGFRGC